ncbi:endonuclease domain-containing protein [Geodermatophilus sp. SYSU D01180]
MPPAPAVPDHLRAGVFRGSSAVASGALTRRQLGGATWRRVLQDVYVHRDVPSTHELRARAAALLLPSAVVTGRSAAVLWGLDLAGAGDDVEVTLRPGTHQVRLAGVAARRAVIRPADVTRRLGLRVTTPEATALRLASVLPRDRAVAAVDQLVVSGRADLAGVRRLATDARGPGCRRARAVAGLADGLAESPQETRLRLLLRGALPAPVAQYRVTDASGGFVARVDFAWPDRRVAVEYDGLWHAEPGQFARDRQRLNRLQAAGWRVVFVTAADLHRPAELIARIAAALAA